jgi:hypothetical protein
MKVRDVLKLIEDNGWYQSCTGFRRPTGDETFDGQCRRQLANLPSPRSGR